MKPQTLRQILLLCLLAAVPATAAALFHPLRPAWCDVIAPDEVTVDDAMLWGEDVLWVDARSAGEYEKERVPGALLLNEDEWDQLSEAVFVAWRPSLSVVVYCDAATCDGSRAVADRLRQETGWESIFVLHGGWSAWQKRNR